MTELFVIGRIGRLTALAATLASLTACTATMSKLFDAPEAAPLVSASKPVTPPADVKAPAATIRQNASTSTSNAPVAAQPSAVAAEQISSLLATWKTSWVSRDVPAYLACYLPSYKDRAATPESWRAARKNTIEKALSIDISIEHLDVRMDGPDRAQVSFRQTYRASNKSDVGNKKLGLRLVDGRWLIEREVFAASK